MRPRRFAGRKCNELDAAIRIEGEDEGLRERREAANERLAVAPVRQALQSGIGTASFMKRECIDVPAPDGVQRRPSRR